MEEVFHKYVQKLKLTLHFDENKSLIFVSFLMLMTTKHFFPGKNHEDSTLNHSYEVSLKV